jgi:hypothetical protein
VHDTPAVHPRHCGGQLGHERGQIIDSRRLRQPGQAGAIDVLDHQRPRVARHLDQLCDPRYTAQPLQDRHLVVQAPLRVGPTGLLADDGAPIKK